MALRIPNEHIPGMLKICSLSDPMASGLIDALGAAKIVPQPQEMAAQIADSVSGIPIEDLIIIVRTVYSLYYVREFSDASPSRFVGELAEAILEIPDIKTAANADELAIRDRFKRLLNVKSLSMISKASRLQREGERLYCEAMILSDIRPVFGDDITSGPGSAVLTHTLKVSYHGDEGHRDFFVVLDGEDLKALGEVVDRAQAKDESLRKVLRGTNIPDLGI
jgi:hypothetical protein